MLYVSRDVSGLVSGIFLKSRPEATEFLSGDHPDILQFFDGVLPEGLKRKILVDLTQSDVEFIRVIEDVVDVLTEKNILTFTDLPEKVREKILNRKDARGRLAGSNELVVPDEWIV